MQLEKEEYLPKKRKKVIYNGNAEFAKVPAILKAREQMRKVYFSQLYTVVLITNACQREEGSLLIKGHNLSRYKRPLVMPQ
jgi:hypothetical protein